VLSNIAPGPTTVEGMLLPPTPAPAAPPSGPPLPAEAP
jgi:phospholipid/cholesterol/gamma-HCH transport system substrate-binding protein